MLLEEHNLGDTALGVAMLSVHIATCFYQAPRETFLALIAPIIGSKHMQFIPELVRTQKFQQAVAIAELSYFKHIKDIWLLKSRYPRGFNDSAKAKWLNKKAPKLICLICIAVKMY